MTGTAVSTATLGDGALSDVKLFYRQEPKLVGPNHFGSRIAFDGKGHVFITQGERNDRPTSQKLDMLQGKLVRLNLDGSVPADNPFVGRKDARPEIWSYGHRNMQSLATDPRTGTVWEAEHGPKGGDEINLPQPGKNYGWPIITHGINYSGLKIPEAVGKEAPGMEQPYHVWEISPGLSGMAFLTAQPASKWNDSLFLGALADGHPNLVPCTPLGCMVLLEEAGVRLEGAEAVVIGRSNLFGKPMAQLLLSANATVTIAHSRTKDLPAVCRDADILVAAVGRPEMVKADWVKRGATVIDVGINRIAAPEKGEGKTRLVGDVAFAEAAEVADVITPVPGGVGPMTIAMLMANTVIAAHRAAGQTPPKF